MLSDNLLHNAAAAARRVAAVPKTENVKELERHLDVLQDTYSGLQHSFHSLSPTTPHLVECVSALVELLGNQNISWPTINKTAMFLRGLAGNRSLHEMLTSQFDLLSAISHILQRAPIGDTCVRECLELLYRLTCTLSVTCPNGYVEDIITFIVNNIQVSQSSDELFSLNLLVLSNICRRNASVEAFLKGSPSIIPLQKKLLSILSVANTTIIITALHIIASLYLREDLGHHIFGSSNTDQTFGLAFNVLCATHSTPIALGAAADLLVDILSSERIQKALSTYPNLDCCLEKILQLIPKADGDTVAKILELCIALSSVPGTRNLLVRTLFSGTQRKQPSKRRVKGTGPPFLALLDWACQSDDAHSAATFIALDLLKEIFEEVLDAGLHVTPPCMECVDVMLPLLASILEPPNYSTSEDAADASLQKIYKALSILSVLWSVESFVAQLSEHIPSGVLNQLIQDQLRNNPIAARGLNGKETMWSGTSKEREYFSISHYFKEYLSTLSTCNPQISATGVKVLMMVFELFLKYKKYSRSVRGLLQQHLQDHRLFPMLAYTLLCCDRRHILVALQLTGEACKAAEFQIICLADALVAINRKCHESLAPSPTQTKPAGLHGTPLQPRPLRKSCTAISLQPLDSKGGILSEGQVHSSFKPATNTGSFRRHTVSSTSIESLIEKFRSGLELKNLKSSEIIEVYEHKLQAMTAKESHLQDLVDAKASALAQADKLIAQYRGRMAQSDEECLKLRSLLQDAERRCENLKEDLGEGHKKEQESLSKIQKLQSENSKLVELMEEHHQLTTAFREQTAQLESIQELLLKQQHEANQLQKMNTALYKQSDTLRSQHHRTIAQVQDLEVQLQSANKCFQAAEAKALTLQKALDQSNGRCSSLEGVNTVLEEKMQKLTTNLETAEQKNTCLVQGQALLEEQRRALQNQATQLQERLSTLEGENAQLQAEVNLFSAVKNLINRRESRM